MNKCYENINKILLDLDVNIYSKINHPSVLTCQEADKYLDNKSGGLKNLLLKVKQKMFICVLLGNHKLDFKKLKTELGGKASFVEENIGISLIGCEVGSVPPFGLPIDIGILVDEKVFNESILYFNPGINTQTIGIKSEDFKKILEKFTGKTLDISN